MDSKVIAQGELPKEQIIANRERLIDGGFGLSPKLRELRRALAPMIRKMRAAQVPKKEKFDDLKQLARQIENELKHIPAEEDDKITPGTFANIKTTAKYNKFTGIADIDGYDAWVNEEPTNVDTHYADYDPDKMSATPSYRQRRKHRGLQEYWCDYYQKNKVKMLKQQKAWRERKRAKELLEFLASVSESDKVCAK